MSRILDLTSLTPAFTKRMANIAAGYRKEYTELTDKVSEPYKESIYWWATPFASRNIFESDAFKNICLLKLATEQASKGYDEIRVPCRELKKAIEKNLTGNSRIKIKVAYKDPGRLKTTLYMLMCGLWPIGGLYLYRLVRSSFKLVIRNTGDIEKKMKRATEACKVLVRNNRMVTEFAAGTFINRYMTGIEELSGRKLLFIDVAYFGSKRERTQAIRETDRLENHVFVEQLLEKKDLLDAFRYSRYCSRIKPQSICLDGMDVTDIVRADIRRGACRISPVYGLLNAIAVDRLIGKYGGSINAVLEWYEGQTRSNAFASMIRRLQPVVLTVAYTYGQLSQSSIQMCPSKSQVENRGVPEVYAVHGGWWADHVRQFCDGVECVMTPSFRDAGIYEAEPADSVEKDSIVVILSLFIKEDVCLLEALAEALPSLHCTRLYIKNHPGIREYRIADYGVNEGLFEHYDVRYLDGDAIEAAKGKETVIAVGTTSALPIMMTGAKLIYYCPPGVLPDLYMPGFVLDNVNIVYDADDIIEAVKKGNPPLTAEMIQEIREKCYTETCKKTTKVFFDKIERMAEEKGDME